jgi:hypothetical protein
MQSSIDIDVSMPWCQRCSSGSSSRRPRGGRRVVARGLEEVQRAGRVDAEVDVRLAGGPVVRRLRGGVDDQLEVAADLADDARDAVAVPDVDRGEAEAVAAGELVRGVRGRGAVAEELPAHVVLDADDLPAGVDETVRGLGPDQST